MNIRPVEKIATYVTNPKVMVTHLQEAQGWWSLRILVVREYVQEVIVDLGVRAFEDRIG